ncbi:MAG TPA: methyltransferase domain-containing protein [Methanosarcinales archaeon]|nr:methyltransferase domain-containing protein [Methanosarcinales archaeon]
MYSWDAKDYHNSSAEQQKWARELISKLALLGGERVLDIGCGDGKVTAEVAQRLPDGSVLGIDRSEEMIRFARRNFPAKRFSNLAFEVMDAENMSFDGEFDVVFSNATLHWVIEHLPVLKGIKKSLKPSGKVSIQMGGRGNAAEVLEVLEKVLENERWNRYFTDSPTPYGFYGPEEYRIWLEKVGIAAMRVELIPKDMTHGGMEGLAAWIRTTWLPYTQKVPEELRGEFIGEIVDRYIEKHPPDDRGTIRIQMMRLEVEATTIP